MSCKVRSRVVWAVVDPELSVVTRNRSDDWWCGGLLVQSLVV